MAFSVNCGIPLPEAMRLSADATASPAMSRDAHRVAYGVEQGESVYKVCQRCALIPSMFGYVLEVNNDTGHLYNALTQLSKAYESRAVHCQSLLRGWLAPAAVIGVGLVIALLIVALFMPLVSLIQSVSC
jgi:type IV pilus assembly protein PilC